MSITVTVLARELLLLREGENWLSVQCAWGVDPSIAFLPSETRWEQDLPEWLCGRRQEVIGVIEDFGLVVEAEDARSATAFGRGDPPDPTRGPPRPITTLDPVSMDELRHQREHD